MLQVCVCSQWWGVGMSPVMTTRCHYQRVSMSRRRGWVCVQGVGGYPRSHGIPIPHPQYWHLLAATKIRTVGKRAVCILLECFLVNECVHYTSQFKREQILKKPLFFQHRHEVYLQHLSSAMPQHIPYPSFNVHASHWQFSLKKICFDYLLVYFGSIFNEDYILQVILNGTICLPAPVTDRAETQFRQEHRIQMDILRTPETRPNKMCIILWKFNFEIKEIIRDEAALNGVYLCNVCEFR